MKHAILSVVTSTVARCANLKTIQYVLVAAGLMLCLSACGHKSEAADAATPMEGLYQFSVLDADSNTLSLDAYQGRVVLVVNTATQCGFTPQYTDLQRLFDLYHSQGLDILDFPCNQFGQQAPGSNADIHEFCTSTYGTTFPQMCKIEVNGEAEAPLYTWLKSQAPFAGFDTTNPIGAYLDQAFRAEDPAYDQDPSIKWNFTKFLIGRDGKVVCRLEPTAGFAEMEEAIKQVL